MTLTENERLMLICLFSLMKAQRLMMNKANVAECEEEENIPSVAGCNNAIEILRCGYEILYDDTLVRTVRLEQKAMRREDGQFVMNVFHMFDDISRYMEEFPEDKEVRDHLYSKFRGFDKNNDLQSYCFARFWVETLEHYSDMVNSLKKKTPGGVNKDPFNSHSTITRHVYQLMVNEWEHYKNDRPLSREQILLILNAPNLSDTAGY